ncbi:MAG: hypothetical protein HY247_03505 [archaeon]|nr:MAG: hypothetical protein HY247_03505 [archaeon]
MIGKSQRMPKRARYPLFLLGLVVMLVGGIEAFSIGAPPTTLAAIEGSGFALLVLAVLFR